MHFIRMKGNETFKMAVRRLEQVCREIYIQVPIDFPFNSVQKTVGEYIDVMTDIVSNIIGSIRISTPSD